MSSRKFFVTKIIEVPIRAAPLPTPYTVPLHRTVGGGAESDFSFTHFWILKNLRKETLEFLSVSNFCKAKGLLLFECS